MSVKLTCSTNSLVECRGYFKTHFREASHLATGYVKGNFSFTRHTFRLLFDIYEKGEVILSLSGLCIVIVAASVAIESTLI